MTLGIPYVRQVHVYGILVWVLPVVAYWVTKIVCRELLAGERVDERRHEAERVAQERADAG